MAGILSVVMLIPTLVELSPSIGDAAQQISPACQIAGCSGQICTERGNDLASTCEWKEEYSCYRELGICEQKSDGSCGWKMTPVMQVCLHHAREKAHGTTYSLQHGDPPYGNDH